MESKSKENAVLFAGFLLILLVAGITLIRSQENQNAQKQNDLAKQEEQPEESLQKDIPLIQPRDLLKEGISSKPPLIFDLRSDSDWQLEHILNSLSPLDPTNISGLLADWNGEKIIIVSYSPQDKASKDFYSALQKNGEKEVFSLSGGIEAWKNIGGTTVTAGNPESFSDQAKVHYTDVDELNNWLKNKEPLYLLDIREAENFAQAHIPGAINIPVAELEKNYAKLPSFSKKIIVIGSDETSEFQAAVRIFDMTMNSPYVLKNAFAKWQEKKFEVAK